MSRKLLLALLAVAIPHIPSARAEGAFPEFVDPHPESDHAAFGTHVVPLSNGNVVITAPGDDFGGPNAGAIHLFHGGSGRLISTITGSRRDDRAGSGGVLALPSGNFVILSPDWNSETLDDVGAATWVNGLTGISGSISAENSLVGSYANDSVGDQGARIVGKGNYVVVSREVQGLNSGRGAYTWCDGTTGLAGPVSAENSLIGSRPDERLTSFQDSAVVVLPNGNFLMFASSPIGNAVTWAKGDSGIRGTISAANSLVGSGPLSRVNASGGGVLVLPNGNYVVHSPGWRRDGMLRSGATTWGSSEVGISGEVSAENSLVGTSESTAMDMPGAVTPLANSHYLVRSATGITWCDGIRGRTGEILPVNSLTGYTGKIQPLPNGHFLVIDPDADVGQVSDAGTVTWLDGHRASPGSYDPDESFTGGQSRDSVGTKVVVLANGNYVILSNGSSRRFSTWADGSTGIKGQPSLYNSLFSPDSYPYYHDVFPLANGHYVVASGGYRLNEHLPGMGAATWCDGGTGRVGYVAPEHSLLGAAKDDFVANAGILPLADGNYVVLSNSWKNQAGVAVGAATWCRGDRVTTGTVNSENSLVGSAGGDSTGIHGSALPDGSYLIFRPRWDLEGSMDHGAATWCPLGMVFPVRVGTDNSLVGPAGRQLGTLLGESRTPPLQMLADGDFVIVGPNPAGGLRSPGSLTWGSKTRGPTGLVSPDNSIIGPTENSRLGILGVIPLPDGQFIAGAISGGCVVWGDGNGGSNGTAVPGNSLMSPPDARGAMTVIVDPVNRSYYASHYFEAENGKVKVGSFTSGGKSIPRIEVELDPGAPVTSGSTTVDFGVIRPGQSLTKTLRIFNKGNWPLEIGTPAAVGPALLPFSASVAGMKNPLISGQSTTFTIKFSPMEDGQNFRTLSIPNSDPTYPAFQMDLLGVGGQPANSAGYQTSGWSSGSLIIPTSRLFGNGLVNELGNFSVVANSTLGGTVRLEGNHIIYTPAAGGGTDTVSINARTTGGTILTGKATINTSNLPPVWSGNLPFVTKYDNGKAGIGLLTRPHHRRNIQISEDLSNWRSLGILVSDFKGRISFLDDASPEFKGFYRLAPP